MLKLPAGACDTHVHVFGPSRVFPYAKGAPFTPADAPKEKLFALHAMLGIQRCVIVQSTCHGYDNRVVADAVAAKHGDYCGVALVPPDVDDAELERLDGQGLLRRALQLHEPPRQGALDRRRDRAHAAPGEARLAPAGALRGCARRAARTQAQALRGAGGDRPHGACRTPRSASTRARSAASSASCAMRGSRQGERLGAYLAAGLSLARRAPLRAGARRRVRRALLLGQRLPTPTSPRSRTTACWWTCLSEIAPSEAERTALLVDNPLGFYRFGK